MEQQFILLKVFFTPDHKTRKGRLKVCLTILLSKHRNIEQVNNVINKSDSDEKKSLPMLLPTNGRRMCQVLRIRVRMDQFTCEDCDKECEQRQLLMYQEVP